MKFFVSYNMIDWFNRKSEKAQGNYRHVLAQRVYLYLIHFSSGRIHKDNLKELVVFFGSSKQNILKALETLSKWGIVICDTDKHSEGGYFRALGSTEFDKKLNYETARYLYQFTKEDLQNTSRFKNLIFKYIGQNVANIYGKKFSNGEKIRYDKDLKITYVLGDDSSETDTYTSDSEDHNETLGEYKRRIRIYKPVINSISQKQSLSYLAQANNRSSKTISNKLKKINLIDNRNESLDIKVKHGKFRSLSSLAFEHHIMSDEQLDNCFNYTKFESEVKEEVQEMIENFAAKSPILAEHSFVSLKDGIYYAANNPTTVFTYTNVDKTSKFNRNVRFGGFKLKV